MQTADPESPQRITVQIDRDLEDIVPVFLANREKDLETIRRALVERDFESIRILGHRMKGDGGGYGFSRITEIGGVMELAASMEDYAALEQHAQALHEFLRLVTVVYR